MKTFPDKEWVFVEWIKEGEKAEFKSLDGYVSSFDATWVEDINWAVPPHPPNKGDRELI